MQEAANLEAELCRKKNNYFLSQFIAILQCVFCLVMQRLNNIACSYRSIVFFVVVLFFYCGCTNMPLTCLAVMFILGVVDLYDQLVFRYILPERFVRLMVNKLDLNLIKFYLKKFHFVKSSNQAILVISVF